MRHLFCISVFIFLFGFSHAQDEKVPQGISDLFYMQYPYATNIKVNKKWRASEVDFKMKGEHYLASYEKNEWRYSLMDYDYNRLPSKVKKGLKSTKYGKKDVLETTLVYLPSGIEEYRIKLKNDSFNNRYIYLNENGKMIRVSPVR